MTKTFRDNCDINIVQRTSCEPLFPDVSTQWKMYFFVPSVYSCMHHIYGVISGRHASSDGVWSITLVARVYTTYAGEQVLVVIRFNATFLPLRPYWEKMPICFLNDAKSLKTIGCVLWCSQIVHIRPYSLNTTTAFYIVTECVEVTVLVWGRVQAKTHSYFSWPWPGLDYNFNNLSSVFYSGCSVAASVRVGEKLP